MLFHNLNAISVDLTEYVYIYIYAYKYIGDLIVLQVVELLTSHASFCITFFKEVILLQPDGCIMLLTFICIEI